MLKFRKKKHKNKSNISKGHVDRFVGNKVYGWLGSGKDDVFPYITANGKPCQVIEYGSERLDVLEHTGLGPKVGFVAELPAVEYSNIVFELSSISMEGIEFVNRKEILGGCLSPNSIGSIFNALNISNKPGSVGIVVWEGTHNPIGRAQVLYNTLKEKRPSVIITFDIGFSDNVVWEPLINSDCKVLILPWKERELYASIINDIGLKFDLVWISKPRLPAFELAKAISHTKTKYILDLDDNEFEMSSSKAAREKPYGLLSAKMAQQYIGKIPTRSVASKTLKDDFGGEFVRHARTLKNVKRERKTDLDGEVRVGFIGTVRPHKGVVEAAKAIKHLNARRNSKIKFVVGGIYDPVSIRSQLIELGCEVHGKIDSARLDGHLQNLDLVITGFPDDDANKEILRYQISSKIGDALSNERPVMVPEGKSVEDLADISGLYLFNSLNFERIIEEAITNSHSIKMDEQFGIPFNFEQFQKLESQAYISGIQASDLFSVVDKKELSANKEQNVILVWKQHDTGLYGRRVDHLARYLCNKGLNVTCLELISESQFNRYEGESVRVDSDFRFLVDDFRNKRDGYTEDGITYKTVSVDYTQTPESGVKRYLLSKGLYPTNTAVVLFPAVPEWKSIVKSFTGYKIVCDVVDNQLAWEKRKPLELLSQYKHLIDISEHVVFNAVDNMKFFDDAGYLNKSSVSVLPNWYTAPAGFSRSDSTSGSLRNEIRIAYSGNMNDRFDWDTVARISQEIELPISIHLIGNCQRSLDKMVKILDNTAIQYHGPMREKDLLVFLAECDLAIMPHLEDEHSGFMNPMKVNMYQSIGIPCVASSMPGVDFDLKGLIQSDSSDDFILKVEKLSGLLLKGEAKFEFDSEDIAESGEEYYNIITNLLK